MKAFMIPRTGRKRALIVVDMQKDFLKTVHEPVVQATAALIEQAPYDAYIECVFHADKGSLWQRETDWTFKLEPTVPDLKRLLDARHAIRTVKTTKSAFGGEKDIKAIFREKGIEEIHVVGVDVNDCVLTTANDAFDAGFFTYVIEECCGSSESEALRRDAIAILRNVDLTNHSSLIKEKEEITL